MKASDLSILDVLDFDDAKGLINLANRRVLLFDSNIIMELRRILVQQLGWETIKPLIFRFGYIVGQFDAKNLGQMYDWGDDEQWFRAAFMMQTQRGQGLSILKSLSYEPEHDRLYFKGRWYNSFEVDSHKNLNLTTKGPVCFVMCGYLSGFSSICFGQDVLVKETSCFPAKEFCIFEGKFSTQWGEQDIKFMESSIDFDIEKKYLELNKIMFSLRKKMVSQNKIKTIGRNQYIDDCFGCRSSNIVKILEMAERVAKTDASVLITGETGVGKEILARCIHNNSQQRDSRFVAINCTALPETLLESELFGHTKGAFTGAIRDKTGLLVEAGLGTIYLDEIGDMPISIQAKLLRALQEKRVRPVGSTKYLPVRGRVISSTNKNLEKMVKEGTFRADFFYRINVFSIQIPPLRKRRDGIFSLARHLLNKYAPSSPGFSPEVASIFLKYNWPGNVRELENAIEYASILAGDKKIQPEHLPVAITGRDKNPTTNQMENDWPSLSALEKRYIFNVLEKCKGRRNKAARILGIGTNTLWRKLKKYESQNTT